jgi:putative transferase (TIGR04331 family)
MKKIIILTKIFNKNKKNFIYLGKWAVNSEDLDKKFKIVDYHWNDINKKKKDFYYIRSLSFKISFYLYKNLNITHNKNYSYKFWKFLLFPWIFRYVCIFFDRWESIETAIKRNKKCNFLAFKGLTFNKSIKNYQDFVELFHSDHGNQKLYQEIISFLNKDLLLFKKIKFANSNVNFIVLIYLRTKKFFFRLIYNKFFIFLNEIIVKNGYNFYFVKVGGLSKKKFNFFDRVYNNSYFSHFIEKLNFNIINSFKPDTEKRILFKKIINNNKIKLKSKFEKFLYKKLDTFIPESLVENFDNYLNKNFTIPNSAFFISSYIHTNDNYHKFSIAKKIENDSKYIILEHGGSLPLYLDYPDIDKELCDYKLTWFKFNKHTYQSPSNPLNYSVTRSTFSKKKNEKLLIFSSFRPRWSSGLATTLLSSQQVDDLDFLNAFRNCLNPKIKKEILIKGPTISKKFSYDWEYLYKKNNYNNITYSRNINRNFAGAKVIISTYPETTFSEALISGVPAILIYSKKFHMLRKEAKFLADEMKKNNMIFNDPVQAAQHINEIWDNPLKWYNSKNVIQVRNNFLDIALNIRQDLDLTKKEKFENQNWKILFKNFMKNDLIKK